MSSKSSNIDLNAFRQAPQDALRSPCPALNCLSAHGYLPCSGRDISYWQLYSALRSIYNISIPLTIFLTVLGFLVVGHNGKPVIPFLGTVDLHDFALHGRIEHDASLVHADVAPGERFAPTTPDKELMNELISEADGRDSLHLDDIVRFRSRREVALENQGKGLTLIQAGLGYAEVALLLSVIGDGEKVSIKRVKEFAGEERFPDDWKRPEKSVGIIGVIRFVIKVYNAIKKKKQA